ncbi:putative respiratory burst oxidase homolog protein H [Lolium perenne]|uniref:putative respiratory burst oxidase homolog protein H n=1 Tax=Lolium perenne TaxID=4522 RepID=UPI0021F6044E|nr:putative respiratory burst oxidase homolog protein H [Lolium perenne]XP_051228280.1 putative respiratory burst oxidase homolog protein H [Lolium perenne]XP_051228281.1 putative respiratory burst oxidase homolog protein H [Lolium perenne]XP_051228282.1 putative respiratory burst oxidase homolog protein H [Lolium perenne]XP_051228283.1 putative respiratory burst oxidase homolog protein H [Lolium perenne]
MINGWEEMSHSNLDAWLRLYFDMCDEKGDVKLREDYVKEIMVLRTSADKLAKSEISDYQAGSVSLDLKLWELARSTECVKLRIKVFPF